VNADEFEQIAERQGRITAEIFRLREQINLLLQASDIATANRLLILISILESQKAKRK
jgi:hypothetical protein